MWEGEGKGKGGERGRGRGREGKGERGGEVERKAMYGHEEGEGAVRWNSYNSRTCCSIIIYTFILKLT